MPMKKTIGFAALIICLLVNCFPANGATNDFTVQLHGERLTLSAEKTPLRAILTKLASQGVIVKLDPQINPLITIDYSNRPVEQVFGAILNDASYSLLWESRKVKGGSTEISLTEIQIFKSGRKDLIKQLLPPKNLVIAQHRDGSYHVKNEILLQLAEGLDVLELESYLQRYNVTVSKSKIPGIYRIVFSGDVDIQAIIREIKKISSVDSAGLNYAYPIQQPVPYPLPLQAAEMKGGYYAPGNNLAPIAILDSGLSTGNPDFDRLVLSSLDVMNPDVAITDTLGHGTQMALIATGLVEPYGTGGESSETYNPVIAIKAFDDNGYISDFNIMESIHFALDNNARVMSLSWGTETNSAFMEKAFEYASAKGLIIVAAAGNEPTGNPVYPAAYPSTIGVGALGPHGTKNWVNSNYGSFVAFYAPGFANMPVGYNGEPGIYAGTSISTAYVASSISSFLSQNPSATTKEVLEFLNTEY
jgi:thermitase